MKSATNQRVKNVFNDVMLNLKEGRAPNVSGTMLKHGYAKTSASTLRVTDTKTWQQLLASIDDDELLEKVRSIALDTDKRAALQAIDMIMKLKDKYPANKLKVNSYNEELERLKVSD